MNFITTLFPPCFPVSSQSSVWSRDPYCFGVLRPFSILWSSTTTHLKFELEQNVAALLLGRWIKAQFDWWRFLSPCHRRCCRVMRAARSHLLLIDAAVSRCVSVTHCRDRDAQHDYSPITWKRHPVNNEKSDVKLNVH